MEHKLFAIYDQKAFAYLPPFTLPRTEMAERTFADCINSDAHAFGKNPADYTLFELGGYDDNKGLITVHETPVVVGTGIEYIQKLTTNSGDSGNGNLDAQHNGPSILPRTQRGDATV